MSKFQFFAFKYFISILVVIILIVVIGWFQLSAGESIPSSEIDTVLRKIATNVIKKSLETAESLEDAAAKMGIDSMELQRICIALDIDMDFSLQKVEPVRLSSLEKLSDNDFEADVILKYNGRSPYVLLVDKNAHSLYLLQYKNGERKLLKTFECKTGKSQGDKVKAGDNKTPEGTFFFVDKYTRDYIRRSVGQDNAYQYGEMAFVMNFPNSIDRLNGKKGGGIWLHGTDEPFKETSPYDTRGCVVITNDAIKTLSRYITLNSTPIIIVEKLNMVHKHDIDTKYNEIMAIIEDWRSAWEEQRIDDYIDHYSKKFRNRGRSISQYKSYKAGIFNAYKINHIKLDYIMLLKHKDSMVVRFLQDYSASNTQGIGIKTLYLVPEKNSWEIVTETFQRI